MGTQRLQVVPLPDDQVSFQIEGRERLKWHFGTKYPRPFLFPLVGASGRPLTRMGHPGAPNHDHHRSVWFGHEKVDGVDFWSDQTHARPDTSGTLALLRRRRRRGVDGGLAGLVRRSRAGADDAGTGRLDFGPGSSDVLVWLQSTFRPAEQQVTLGQSNFGLLGLRTTRFGELVQ